MLNLVTRFIRDESGAAIAAIIILTVFYLGGYVLGAFSATCSAFSSSGSVSHVSTGGTAC